MTISLPHSGVILRGIFQSKHSLRILLSLLSAHSVQTAACWLGEPLQHLHKTTIKLESLCDETVEKSPVVGNMETEPVNTDNSEH